MSKQFRPWRIDQVQLLSPSVQDFVADDHLSRFVVTLMRESLDLSAITVSYKRADFMMIAALDALPQAAFTGACGPVCAGGRSSDGPDSAAATGCESRSGNRYIAVSGASVGYFLGWLARLARIYRNPKVAA